VWAVGDYNHAPTFSTLAEHWDGTQWSVVPSPNAGGFLDPNFLYVVAAISSTDVWAVGNYNNGTADQTLAEHWNGTQWSVVSSPNPGGDGNNNDLSGVAAVSASDVWAVGHYNNGTADQTLAEHWNGTQWSVVPSPNPGTGDTYLYGVAAISSSDVWAVGNQATGSLTEHWDGAAWSIVPSPPGILFAVAAVSSSDVWAVGDYNNGTADQTLAEHYNPCPPTNTPLPTQTPGGPTATPGPPTATPTVCPLQFTDVPPGSTFYPYIRCLACRGIINGYPDGTFKPHNQVTRGQLSKIVSNAAGFTDAQTTQLFQDVPVGSTFQVYVGRLASRSYIGGYPCGGVGEPCVPPGNLPYFRPGNNATRGQISKIDANAAGFSDPPSGQQFEDVAVGSAFYTYTFRLVSRNVMGGYPCGGVGEPCVPPGNLPYFRPNNNATRGQTSKIVANTFFPDCQTPALK
jgi:hypothetical protein